MTVTNAFEEQAREVKAQKLATLLHSLDFTSDELTRLDERGWVTAAVAAGVKAPSEKTRQLVIRMVGAQ